MKLFFLVLFVALTQTACYTIPYDTQYPPYYDPYATGSNPIATYCWNPDPVKAAFCRGQVDA